MAASEAIHRDRVVAVINGKGGVLKTTLTANIGGLLAHSGYHVLLVDLDPQGNLAEDLGYTETSTDDEGAALARGLIVGGDIEVVKDVRPNLDVLPGGTKLEEATAALVAVRVRARLAAAGSSSQALLPCFNHR